MEIEASERMLRKKSNLENLMLESSFGVMLVVLGFSAILVIFTDDFLSGTNFFSTSRAFSLWIMVGFSQMMALVIGHMNLSAGAIGGLSAVVTGFMFQNPGTPAWAGVAVGLVVGLLCGAFNGFFIVKTGINAFIITLGTTSVFTGLNLGLTHSLPFPTIPEALTYVGRGKVFEIFPVLFFIMLAVALVLGFLFRFTVLGRWILATGGNREAAVMSGINVKSITILVHTLSGLLAGLAGVLFVCRLGSAHPTIGQNWLLMSFAIPVIGGTALVGGTVSITGVVLGGVLMTLISNGLVLLEVDIFWEQFFMGLLVLVAVVIDRARTVYGERRYG